LQAEELRRPAWEHPALAALGFALAQVLLYDPVPAGPPKVITSHDWHPLGTS
jgi:hypothetical protein